ncbi:NAD-dependent epimerase/dehydratase family protein [Candidatus Pelagibacter sp.]|jgi:GDP-L-fucose synthase|nr:NAD-dependent epimerase/dehydratase family protein [Candidatus Pelagibacter sp.]
MKVLITGGNGYIAKSIKNSLWDKYHIIAPGREELDLLDSKSVDKFFEGKYFDIVIHTAAVGGSRLKEEDETISFYNLIMFYNLIRKKEQFNKLISFGSGAEYKKEYSPYGFSKSIINKLVHKYDNFYTLRIYGVFNEDELETRFIKASINNVLQENPINIHQDKLMDFIYMPDLISIVDFYITHTDLLKEIDCIYDDPFLLSDIAKYINNHLSVNKVPINIEDPLPGENYIGTYSELPITFIGLEQGIKNVYNKLK